MRRGRKLFALPGVVLACVGLFACPGTTEVDDQELKSAEDWAWLQQAKSDIDGKRAELAELQSRIDDGSPAAEATDQEAAEAGAEAASSPEELAAQAAALQGEVYGLADTFGARLAQFINDQAISVGSERTEIQSQAIRMKSDEDIELAREYIEKGGEYQRAIDIYVQAQSLDPDNEKLAAAIADAEARRYMTEERLAEVKKDMTKSEVRAILGTPRVQNIREFDGGVIGWFFPKEEPNTAAAVFFRKKKDALRVYKTDFEAVKAPKEASES